MIIHAVQEGDTIQSIAEKYRILQERLLLENEISDPDKLVVGETLVILYPKTTYTVKEGDTLGSIANKHDVTVMQLLRNNAYLSNRQYIYQGETLVISYEDTKKSTISVNGYVYPFVDHAILKKTLPFLTYLTIFSYRVSEQGEIYTVEDDEIIQMANAYGVAPIMMVVAGESQAEESNVIHTILMNPASQDVFIERLLINLKSKGYYGVNISTPYIHPEDRSRYVEFMSKFSKRISKEGIKVFNSFSLNTFEILTNVFYEGLEYDKIGQMVDYTMLISYEWGYLPGLPSGIISNDTVRQFIIYMSQKIPPEKIMIGISNIGHLWALPYEAGISRGMAINYSAAVELAYYNNAEIQYDYDTNSAYFQYISPDEYIARFRDARSMDAWTNYIMEFKLNGCGIWNTMNFFSQQWLVINSQYEIEKV